MSPPMRLTLTIGRGPIVQCRYLTREGDLCTAEAVDPDALILLCTKHLARAMQLIRQGVSK